MGQRGVPVIKVDGQVMVGFNRARLEQLLAQSAQRAHPKLGASVADAARHRAQSGAYVGRVREGSAAAQAGMRSGDIITMLAGQPVQNADDVERIMRGVQPRARVPARVRRDGGSEDLSLQF